jgi:nitroreductase
MDTLTAIRERCSVKHYDPNHTMPEAEINGLLEMATRRGQSKKS